MHIGFNSLRELELASFREWFYIKLHIIFIANLKRNLAQLFIFLSIIAEPAV